MAGIAIQSSIPNAIGCNVYASDNIPGAIYLELSEPKGTFMELRIKQ